MLLITVLLHGIYAVVHKYKIAQITRMTVVSASVGYLHADQTKTNESLSTVRIR